MVSASQYFKQVARKLSTGSTRAREDDILEEARLEGASWARDCEAGNIVTLVGEIHSLSSCAQSLNMGVTAEFSDGTDTVLLVWIGRPRIVGLYAGQSIRVRGRLGCKENGTKVMYNPYYELLHET